MGKPIIPLPTRYIDGSDFDASNAALLRKLPDDQLSEVLSSDMCDIDGTFLGFVNVYDHLSKIIPVHFTVVDLGCAYAPQAFLFDQHAEYVGVDVHSGARFAASNSRHHVMSIEDFISRYGGNFPKETTFAICSYVPPWGGNNIRMVREYFSNVFTYYPSGPAPG